jgi:hypothetical protein
MQTKEGLNKKRKLFHRSPVIPIYAADPSVEATPLTGDINSNFEDKKVCHYLVPQG